MMKNVLLKIRYLSRTPGRRYLPMALMAFGAVLICFVALQYTQMYREQRRLAQQWEQQQAQPLSQVTAGSDDRLTRLTVPKIDLDSFVVEGTSQKALLRGPGHMENSAKPGEPGNAVITSHRDTFFRHIYELEKGDVVLVRRQGRTFRYEVTGKKIVAPDDMSVLRPSQDARLTLITCYPTYYIGPAPKRLVVFSKLVSEERGAANVIGPSAAAAAKGSAQ